MVVIARRFDFDVLAQHVEPGLAQPFYLPLHRFVGRRRVQAVWPPALIERAVLKQRLPIEQDHRLPRNCAGTERNLAQAEIAGDDIEWRTLGFGLLIHLAFPRAKTLTALIRAFTLPGFRPRIFDADELGL